MKRSRMGIVVSVLAAACLVSLPSTSRAEWCVTNKIMCNSPSISDFEFGKRIAPLGTNRFLVGVPKYDAGTNGDAGVVYVFDAVSGALALTITNPAPCTNSGFGVGVGSVGTNRILIGARSGAVAANGIVYICNPNGSIVSTVTNPMPVFDGFGSAVAGVSTDRFVVGAYGCDSSNGRAYLYNINGTLLATVTNPAVPGTNYFGGMVTAVGTNRFLVGAYLTPVGSDAMCGQAYLYNASGVLLATITNPGLGRCSYFGYGMGAVGNDKFAIGACVWGGGETYLFDIDGNYQSTIRNPLPEQLDWFGVSVAGVGSNKLLIGAAQDGEYGGSTWLYDTSGTLLDATYGEGSFGFSVASLDSDTIVASAPSRQRGEIRVCKIADMPTPFAPGKAWNVTKELPSYASPNAAAYGRSSIAALGSDRYVAGYRYHYDGAYTNAGLVYVLDASTGQPTLTITNPQPATVQFLGSAVATLGTNRILAAAAIRGVTNGLVLVLDAQGNCLATVTNPTSQVSDQFGATLAGVSTNRFVVGAPGWSANSGRAYLYDLNGTLLATLTSPESGTNYFGVMTASVGTNRFLVGAYYARTNQGACYLYDAGGSLLTTITNPGIGGPYGGMGWGFGLSASAVGKDRFVVGAYRSSAAQDSAVCLYDANGTYIRTIPNPYPITGLPDDNNSSGFGYAVSGLGSNKIAVGDVINSTCGPTAAGSILIFDLDGNLLSAWNGEQGDYLGSCVIGVGEDTLVVGAYGRPKAFLCKLANTAPRYDFESGGQGWTISTDTGSVGITSVQPWPGFQFDGVRCLRLNCNLVTNPLANQQGEVQIDMASQAPADVLLPVNLNNKHIYMKMLCPQGSSGQGAPGSWGYHQLAIFVKDENGYALYDTVHPITAVPRLKYLSLLVSTNTPQPYGYRHPNFDPTKVRYVGVKVLMKPQGGPYTNRYYLDDVWFEADTVPILTNTTQHHYDFEAAYQQEWWKWDTNPDGWEAQAWTNVYYATNQGVNGSVALAANAHIVTNGSMSERKGVFEIAYQPALNLSTKDHRKIQARMRFSPAYEGTPFDVSINVFDKLTDQWYKKDFKAGGGNWNTLTFDLDQTNEYTGGLPVPMNTEDIGYVTIQVYGNANWDGVIYLDDVVVGGKETGTNYTKLAGAFVKPNSSKFIVGETNFYFCGANIEYLQTVPDRTVRECLDWAASNHLQVVRTWAMQEGKPYSFQPQRGVWNEVMFEHLDRIVAEAGNRGIRLMLGVCDNWAHNGGVFQYMHWVYKEHPETVNTNFSKEGVLYHDQFWTNTYAKQWYRDYVTKLLGRTNTITGVAYRNDPTIFAWEIINEPRCESDFSGRTIHNWLNEMSDFVRTIDTNHMLGNGEEGGYVNTYDFADTIPWEVYPDNYFHYGTYATGSSTCDLYGCGRGHGVDYLSDNKSESTWVSWQDGFYTNRGPTNVELRAGNSNINFCTARIYVDQKEYNVWRTNQNGADQKFEWINDHWYDSQMTIGKPMILEEFGIHAIGWVFNGSYGQVQLRRTPEYTFLDRVNIYSQYYAHVENSGISGSFFWNFGYDGMWDDVFHACEQVSPWYADTGTGAALSVATSVQYVRQGSNSLQLSWNYTGAGANQAIFRCPTNEQWVLRVDNASTNEPPTHGINRTKFFWSFYNPNAYALDVALAIVGGPSEYWCEGVTYSLTSGWNRVMFDLSAGNYAWVSNGWQNSEYLINIPNSVSNVLEDVKQVCLVFKNLPTGAGDVFIDDVKVKRDDGFVVYADDPVNPVIRWHADRMQAKNFPTNRANAAPVASNLWVVADPNGDVTPFTLMASDANDDPLSFRIKTKPSQGWVFGTPPNLVYKPKLGSRAADTFTYVAYDGLRESAEGVVTIGRTSFDNLRYSFETGTEGWYANYQTWAGYGITGVVRTTERALHSNASLKAWVVLNTSNYHDRGDAEVDMEYNPPAGVQSPVNLDGQPLQISVYCPAGSRGSPSNPNRIQIYAKDRQWLAEWGGESNIVEGQWMTLLLTISSNAQPGVWTDTGFNPQKIRAVGVRIIRGGAGSDYTGPIYIDPVTFPVMGYSLYGFRTDTEGWTNEDWGCGAPVIRWTNSPANPSAGALWVAPGEGAGYGKFYVKDFDKVDNENLLYRPILQTYVWVPCDAPDNPHHAVRARLYARSSSDGWSYAHMSQEFVLAPCQWNLLSWDMSGLPTNILMDVDELGLELVWGNRDVWDGAVVIDSINVLPKMPTAAPQVVSVTPATNSVGKYQKYEVTVGLANVQGLNPYDPHMVDLNATFTSPLGRSIKVNGFYLEDAGDAVGNGKWKIRFAADELGAWSYRVSVGNHLGASTSAVYNFTCAASDRHGWIKVSDNDSHYFEHADDTPFIGKGYCHPWDGDDEGIFANAEEHGINMLHWWMAPWDTMLTVKPANPQETWREKSSYDTYEQGRALETDRVIGYAEKHNVKLVFTIWPHDSIRDFNHHKWRINGSWAKAFDQKFSEPELYINAFSELDDPPKNQKFFYDETYKEYQNRLYRYIIARWGYSEAIGAWALVSELFGTYANSANCARYQDPLYVTNKAALNGENPYLNMDTNQCDGADHGIEWLTYINSYFKTNDPFGHPTTASYGTDEYWDGGFPIVDVPQIHVYADLYNYVTPPTTLAKYQHKLHEEYVKPAFMGEIGTVEWKAYEPDYTRVVNWPAVCAGAAIAPMMWTTPAFSYYGDAKMGPWYDAMSDEMKVFGKFMDDIPFHKLHLQPADAATTVPNEPAVTVVESFEGGFNNWNLWGVGITNRSITTNHATLGTNSLRLEVNMGTYAEMPNAASGIEKYEGDGFVYNWSNYWPRGTVKMDVFIPEFYHPTNNPDGFLLGINKDPRSIVEIATKDEGGNWHWYSTTNEYGGPIRESGGWKKLTVGMLWNLELPLTHIPTAYEAAHIVGLKFWFGDVGILRGPIFLDNITAGMYAYNTCAMVSSNRDFAFAWIQDRTWTNGVIASNGVFRLNGLSNGVYNLEWWDTRVGCVSTFNANASTGTLSVTVPPFNKDIAVKIRRIGAVGATVHDVAIAQVQEYDWIVRSASQRIDVSVVNQGTATETFNVTLTDTTDSQAIGTVQVANLAAGAMTNVAFYWNSQSASLGVHTLTAEAATVAGETDTADNTLAGRTKLVAAEPPWDSCDRLRRWAPDSSSSDGRSLTVQTNAAYVTEGGESFAFYHRSPEKYQAYFGFDNVYESWADKKSFVIDVYNPDGATNIQFLLRTGADWTWHFSPAVSLAPGWNTNLTFSLKSPIWTRQVWDPAITNNVYYYDVPVSGLDEVQQIFIKFGGYPAAGTIYVDNMRLIESEPDDAVYNFETDIQAWTSGVGSVSWDTGNPKIGDGCLKWTATFQSGWNWLYVPVSTRLAGHDLSVWTRMTGGTPASASMFYYDGYSEHALPCSLPSSTWNQYTWTNQSGSDVTMMGFKIWVNSGSEFTGTVWIDAYDVKGFLVAPRPSYGSVQPNRTNTSAVVVNASASYDGDNTMTLTAENVPAGVTVGFDPSASSLSFTSVMTIAVGPAVTQGVYSITIRGTGTDGKTDTRSFALSVSGGVDDSKYSFESGNEGFSSATWTDAIVYKGTGAVSVLASSQPTRGVGAENWSTYDSVTVWAFLPDGVGVPNDMSLKIHTKSDAYNWREASTGLARGQWTLCTMGRPADMPWSNVTEVGFSFVNLGSYTGVVYLDSVRLNGTALAPTYNPDGGTFTNSVNVTLSSTTPGATIYYTTDGSAPTTNSASVPSGNSIALTQPYSGSVRALAKAAGYQNSAISTSLAFSVVAPPVAAAPTYAPDGGTFTNSVNVTLSSTTPGATIYYTTDGSAPTTNSASVPSGNSIALTQPYSGSVRALANAAGYQDSAISTSLAFSVVAPPVAAAPTYAPNGGTYTGTVSVVLSSTTPGSTIHYTTNGTAPTTNSASVASGGSIVLTQPYSNNVRALTRATGYANSPISTSVLFRVVTGTAAAPTYAPNGGTYTNSVSVTLSSTTPGSTIHYTTNGTAPTTNSASVASGGSIVLTQTYSNRVRALTRAAGYANSTISTSVLFRVVAPPAAAAPTYAPNGGTYSGAVSVVLSSTTPGSTIHYTTNGTAPTTNSVSVPSGGNIVLAQSYSNRVRALTRAAGYGNSTISTSALFIVKAATPRVITNTVLDMCQTAAFTNNNGTTNWNGAWTELGESDGAGAGYVRVGYSDLSSNRMSVAFTNRGACREANLSGCSTAVLSFIYRRNGLDNTNDYVTVSISSNGGAAWVELGRFKGPATDSVYRTTNYNVKAYASTNTQVRFLSSAFLATNDYVNFDDIKILFTRQGAVPPMYAPNGGTFTNSVSVTLSSIPGSTIHYTTNGTAPTTNSPSVASGGSIVLTQPYSNSVRALAKASGYVDSPISTSALFRVSAGGGGKALFAQDVSGITKAVVPAITKTLDKTSNDELGGVVDGFVVLVYDGFDDGDAAGWLVTPDTSTGWEVSDQGTLRVDVTDEGGYSFVTWTNLDITARKDVMVEYDVLFSGGAINGGFIYGGRVLYVSPVAIGWADEKPAMVTGQSLTREQWHHIAIRIQAGTPYPLTDLTVDDQPVLKGEPLQSGELPMKTVGFLSPYGEGSVEWDNFVVRERK